MDFCITCLIRKFEPSPPLRSPSPMQTAWGEAVRVGDEGKLFWPGNLYVRVIPRMPHLIGFLHADWQEFDWTLVEIGGAGLAAFEQRLREPAEEGPESELIVQAQPLYDLLHRLLSDQPNWAVFCERHCDQINHTFHDSIDGLCRHLGEAYRGIAPSADGFCAIGVMTD